MVRWLQHEGHDAMMDPEPFAVMGLVNGGRDIPVMQMGLDGRDGRYVISLVGFRSVHEFVLHRKQNDVLTFHHCDTKFVRYSSVRYPRNGKPVFITDTASRRGRFPAAARFLVRPDAGSIGRMQAPRLTPERLAVLAMVGFPGN